MKYQVKTLLKTKMAEKCVLLDALEKRLYDLERRVIINEEAVQHFEETSCLDTLFGVQQEVDRISLKFSRIQAVWKKLKELETFLAPEFLEQVTLTDEAKADIIIAGENHLKSCAEQLRQVEDFKKVVDTEPLKDLPTWCAKLDSLTEVHIQQQDEFTSISERLKSLLTAYNNVIAILSKQFIHWDNVLTEIEQAVDVKPSD